MTVTLDDILANDRVIRGFREKYAGRSLPRRSAGGERRLDASRERAMTGEAR